MHVNLNKKKRQRTQTSPAPRVSFSSLLFDLALNEINCMCICTSYLECRRGETGHRSCDRSSGSRPSRKKEDRGGMTEIHCQCIIISSIGNCGDHRPWVYLENIVEAPLVRIYPSSVGVEFRKVFNEGLHEQLFVRGHHNPDSWLIESDSLIDDFRAVPLGQDVQGLVDDLCVSIFKVRGSLNTLLNLAKVYT